MFETIALCWKNMCLFWFNSRETKSSFTPALFQLYSPCFIPALLLLFYSSCFIPALLLLYSTERALILFFSFFLERPREAKTSSCSFDNLTKHHGMKMLNEAFCQSQKVISLIKQKTKKFNRKRKRKFGRQTLLFLEFESGFIFFSIKFLIKIPQFFRFAAKLINNTRQPPVSIFLLVDKGDIGKGEGLRKT